MREVTKQSARGDKGEKYNKNEKVAQRKKRKKQEYRMTGPVKKKKRKSKVHLSGEAIYATSILWNY